MRAEASAFSSGLRLGQSVSHFVFRGFHNALIQGKSCAYFTLSMEQSHSQQQLIEEHATNNKAIQLPLTHVNIAD